MVEEFRLLLEVRVSSILWFNLGAHPMGLPVLCYIDDDQSNLNLIAAGLGGEFDIKLCSEPLDGMALFEKWLPKVILLDVSMPVVSGYELCQSIRQHPKLSSTPVVFLSARSDMDDRLKGFDVGGDAYVTKPVNLDELSKILQAQGLHHDKLLQTREDLKRTSDMALDLMRDASEFGHLILCARTLSKSDKVEEFISAIFTALESFGLASALMLKLPFGEVVVRSDEQLFSLLEQELLSMVRDGQRITTYKNKYLFAGKYCIFLIKNMPVENTQLCERLSDHLLLLIESCDSAADLLNYKFEEKEKRLGQTSGNISTLEGEFNQLHVMAEKTNKEREETFESLCQEIEGSFYFLGMTDKQEEQLTQYIEKARKKLYSQEYLTARLNEAMNKIKASLSSNLE